MPKNEIPIFPLRTVLYPDGPLPLRIFETRYLDMISRCLRDERGFGVVLIREGNETGPSEAHSVGTMAEIVDWYQGSDGLLGVTARGRERFRLLNTRVQPDGLNVGTAEPLELEPAVPLPATYRPLAEILEDVLGDLGRLYEPVERRYGDATWVGYRFAEILPISLEQKQFCLELEDAVARLELISSLMRELRGRTPA